MHLFVAWPELQSFIICNNNNASSDGAQSIMRCTWNRKSVSQMSIYILHICTLLQFCSMQHAATTRKTDSKEKTKKSSFHCAFALDAVVDLFTDNTNLNDNRKCSGNVIYLIEFAVVMLIGCLNSRRRCKRNDVRIEIVHHDHHTRTRTNNKIVCIINFNHSRLTESTCTCIYD